MKRYLRHVSLLALVAAVFSAGIAAAAPSAPETPSGFTAVTAAELSAVFQSANESYEAGEYGDAVASYERLAAAGVQESDLYYNLANAYFKEGDMGRSVLNYERALRLSPRNRDARSNIALVRSLLKDKQFVTNQHWIGTAVTWLQRNLRLNEALLLASLLYLMLALIAIGFIFYDTAPVTAIHRRLYTLSPGRLLGLAPKQECALTLVLVCLLFFAAAGLSFYKVRENVDRSRAVVVEEEVPVHSAPSKDSVLKFRIHAGTTVDIKENRTPWVRISLPGDLTGWIPADSAERI